MQDGIISYYPEYSRPSIGAELYLLFLLVVCGVAIHTLMKIWRGALPFRLTLKPADLNYLRLVREASWSLGQWIGCIFLAFGILVSTSLTRDCYRIIDQKEFRTMPFLLILSDFSKLSSVTLFVVFFIFLIRWHVIRRGHRLRTRRGG